MADPIPQESAPLGDTLRDWLGSPKEEDAERRRAEREELLRRSGLLDDPLDPELQAAFDRVTEQVRALLGAPTSLLTFIAGDRQFFRAKSGHAPPEREKDVAGSLCRYVRDSAADLVVADVLGHPLGQKIARAEPKAHGSYIGAPVFLRDENGHHHPVASLCAADDTPRTWTVRDLDALRALADGVSTRLALMASLAEAKREREVGLRRERELEEFYAALPVTIVIWKPGGEVVYVSPKSTELMGVSPALLLGGQWIERIHPDDRPEVIRRATETPLEAAAPRPAYRMLGEDGAYRTLVSRTVSGKDHDGSPRFVSILTDVTNVREAEAALAEERTRLRAILDGVPSAIVLTDAEGRVRDLNPQAVEYGYRIGESTAPFAGHSAFLIEEGGREYPVPVEKRPLLRALAGEDASPRLFRLHKSDAEDRFVRSGASVLRNAEGEITGALVTCEDVTREHRLELAALGAREAIENERRRGERRLEQFLNAMPIFAGLISPEGEMLFVNEAPLRAFGRRREDMVGKLAYDIEMFAGDPEARAILREILEACAAGQTVERDINVRWEGRTIEMVCYAAPILDAEGGLLALATSAVDVTERNANRRALEAEERRLRQLVDSLPLMVGLCDAEGNVRYANRVPLEMAGLRLEDVVGRPIWGPPWPASPESEAKTRAAVESATRGVPGRATIVIAAGDARRTFDFAADPILRADGSVGSIVATALDVTDRAAAARAAESELARLREVLDGMRTSVKLFDAQGELLTANAATFRAHGSNLEDLRGRQMWELPWFRRDDLEAPIREAIARARSGETARLTIRDGVGTFETTVVPIRNGTGDLNYLLVESVDVSEARNAAAEAEADRERLRAVIEALPIGLFLLDHDWNVLQANEEAYRAIGITPEEMRERRYLEGTYLEADGSERPMTLDGEGPVPRALRGDPGPARTMRFWRHGEPPEIHRFVTIAAAPLRNANGEIEAAVMTAVDVKPLRQAQEAIVRTRLEGAERLRRTLESLPLFIALFDPAGRLVYANAAALAAVGARLEDVLDAPAWETPWVRDVPETKAVTRDAFLSAQGGRPFAAEAWLDTRRGRRECELSVVPMYDDGGGLAYILTSAVDVTERNAARRDLEATSREARHAQVSAERAKEAAERATRAKDEFLSVLSHELRTPLTPAMLGLELMAADIEIIERASAADRETLDSIRDTFESVRQNLGLQVRLIDDLLDVTRIARGKLELHRSPVDLHEAIRHAVEITSVDAIEKGLTVRREEGAEFATVLGDPGRIRQILWNLLANAVKFTPRGGTITISTRNPSPESVLLSVCDSGRGIAPGKEEVIFNAFEQGGVGVTRDFGGLGLGLAISRSLAVAHGSSLTARSDGLDRGACFDLAMPTYSASEGEDLAPETPILFGGAPPSVLLVEDNPDTARMTAELLRRTGATVDTAHSLAAAVALLEGGGAWQVLLTDLGLPDGDGIGVYDRVRAALGPIPAVAMSGFGAEEDRRRTREAGFRDHLVKPVTFAQVQDALRRALA